MQTSLIGKLVSRVTLPGVYLQNELGVIIGRPDKNRAVILWNHCGIRTDGLTLLIFHT